MKKTAPFILPIILLLAACSQNVYSISVPEASQVRNIELAEDGRTTVISDSLGINVIVNALKNTDPQTKNESVQDFPVNAEDIVSVNINLNDNTAFSVFLYERNDRYYMEQPYNGIYKMKEKDYDAIEEFADRY